MHGDHRARFAAWIAAIALAVVASAGDAAERRIDRAAYAEKLEGFWLGQCIGNWTGLVTEMDKIGGNGPHGRFYTWDDWGGPDQPAIWGDGQPSRLSPTIDFVFADADSVWGADDDTDIEYMYQHLLLVHETSVLTGEQIRDGWLRHTYAADETPFRDADGNPENFLWVSNQRARDLMADEGLVPPHTSDPARNPHVDMIDAQLTTEIFGLLAPGRPDVALGMARLPILTTARGDARAAAEFYVVMHSLAAVVDPDASPREQVLRLARRARPRLPEGSYVASMYDFVHGKYTAGVLWEDVRDELHRKYQVRQEDGYDISARGLWCNGCFASGINFGASLISLFYGEGDLRRTIRIATLAGWDSDNPAATWGGLLGFLLGRSGVEAEFGRTFSVRFDIHRTRRGFPIDGHDSFGAMAARGCRIVDRVVREEMGGRVDVGRGEWIVPMR
mgnify:CR=1 FL=1